MQGRDSWLLISLQNTIGKPFSYILHWFFYFYFLKKQFNPHKTELISTVAPLEVDLRSVSILRFEAAHSGYHHPQDCFSLSLCQKAGLSVQLCILILCCILAPCQSHTGQCEWDVTFFSMSTVGKFFNFTNCLCTWRFTRFFLADRLLWDYNLSPHSHFTYMMSFHNHHALQNMSGLITLDLQSHCTGLLKII